VSGKAVLLRKLCGVGVCVFVENADTAKTIAAFMQQTWGL
jgi:hypothetical protein